MTTVCGDSTRYSQASMMNRSFPSLRLLSWPSIALALLDYICRLRISRRHESKGRMRLTSLVSKPIIAFYLVSLSACTFYAVPPFEAWVVDASSGRQLEGVIVVAHWQA